MVPAASAGAVWPCGRPPVQHAEQLVVYRGVRMLFVVTEMPSRLGLITTTDLRSDRAVRLVHERGRHHDELTVGDVMTALAQLDAVELDTLRTATVRNLISTLKRHGRNHLLVVEGGGATPLRAPGVISRAQVERQLGTPIALVEVADRLAQSRQMPS